METNEGAAAALRYSNAVHVALVLGSPRWLSVAFRGEGQKQVSVQIPNGNNAELRLSYLNLSKQCFNPPDPVR